MKSRNFSVVFLVVLGFACVAWSQTKPTEPDNRLDGVVYDAVKPGPDGKPVPLTKAEVRRDVAFIARFAKAIKTINCLGPYSEIPEACDLAGIDCYLAVPFNGAPFCADDIQGPCDFERAIGEMVLLSKQGHRSLKGVTVGFMAPWKEKELAKIIRRVKRETALPVGMMSDVREWKAHRELIDEVDFIMLNCWPHGGGFSVEDAAAEVARDWQAITAIAGTKKVIIGETGWPTVGNAKGDAVISPAVQAQFLKNMTAVSRERKITTFWSQAFDRKAANDLTEWQSLGICSADGKVKPDMEKLLPEQARPGIKRGKVDSSGQSSSVPPARQGQTPGQAAPPASIKVDGKPFFVIDARCTDPRDFAEVAKAGFNTVSYVGHEDAKAYLGEAKRYGLHAICYTGQKPDWSTCEANLHSLRNDPTLLAWIMPANPVFYGIPEGKIKQAYDKIRSADSNRHSIKLNEVPTEETWPRLSGYMPYCDALAIMPEPYAPDAPSLRKLGLRDPILAQSYWADKAVALAKDKPVLMFVQAHKMKQERPTPNQMRSMAYLAVNHGASGVLIDGFKARLWEEKGQPASDVVGMGDVELTDLRKKALQVAGELKQLSPAILAGAVLNEVTVGDNDSVIDLKAYAEDKRLYVVAVNSSNKDVKPKFGFRSPSVPAVQVLGESRTVTRSDDGFADTFVPYETHVYVLALTKTPAAGDPMDNRK